MIIYVIHKQKLFSVTLPLRVSGSYPISDIDNNGKERMLINISEEDGKWVAYSNKNTKIWQDEKMLDSVILENYQYLLLQIKGIEGYLVLFVCPVNDEFIGVTVKEGTSFIVGSGSDTAIRCNNPLIGHQHVKLTYNQGSWMLENINTEYGSFVNNKSSNKQERLFHGDVVFILGLKLIIMGNNLYFNNPMKSVSYDKNLFSPLVPREKVPAIEFSEDDNEIKLYEDKDYFVRSPRFMEVLEEKPFKIDPHPSFQEPENAPMILTVGPMLTMGMSSSVMLIVAISSYQSNSRSLMSILPTMAMSVAMLAGTILWPTLNKKYAKKQQLKKKKKIEDKYGEYLIKKETELIEIGNSQRQVLLSNNISPIECYKLIVSRSKNLWMRELHQNDFLTLRLGVGRVPLKISFNYPEEKFQLDEDELDNRMRDILEKHKYIDGVPVIESFIEKNIVAITGKYGFIKNYIDILILQMITFHSYYDLKIVLLTEKSKIDGWNYLKQVPHLFRNDKLMRFLAADFDEGKEVTQYLFNVLSSRLENFKDSDNNNYKYKNFSPYYVIITDDYENVKSHPFIEKLLQQKDNLGFSLIIMNQTLANLPTECKAFIGVNSLDEGGIFENELKKDTQKSFQIETLSQVNLDECGVILNNIPIENKDESFNLPKTLGFLEMFDIGNVEQLNSLERWKVNDPINSLAAPIGMGMNGNIFKLDLHEKEQGPHGLIAGMTGSGKSEFIITYILSMAVNYHPDEVQFVLIDYKGGGLVGAFENNETGIRLPHLAGTITNLDEAEINRALASIESELKRRQSLFNKAREKLNEGTIDIYKYQKYYREGLIDIPLSHLFIISDEFAELKSQQPEFMDQLISTARIGRSLGVHLILATQKPSGVVNDQIWSNARFKVSLKVQDASDSNEVIKRPDAAYLKDVGRFYLQVGYNEFFAMGQASYAGVPYIPQDKVYHEVDNKINFINNIGKSIKTIDMPKKDIIQAKGEELSNIVKYLNNLAVEENIKVKELWLEKLANIIYVDDIKKKYQFKKSNFEIEAVIGAYDNPKLQTQGLFTLDLFHGGNAVIYSMNEKNTIVNTIIYSLITTYHTKEVNIYIMDFDSQTMKIYKDAPQVGDVIFGSESEKVNNVFKMLGDEIEHRKKLFQDYNGSYEFYCKNSGKTVPSIIFMVYGYENFKEEYDDKDTLLAKISREGFKYGIYVILTAISDRSLRLSMRSNFPQIIPLKLSSAMEYNMILGKKTPLISDVDGRGVALINEEPYEFQTAIICDSEKQNEYLKSVISSLKGQIVDKAPIVRILPEHVSWKDILLQPMSINRVPIGLVVDTLDISYYDFTKSLINLFSASDITFLKHFSKVLIHKLSDMVNVNVLVCDEKKYFSDIQNIKSSSFEEVDKIISDVNQNKINLIFVTGVEKWISTIPDGIRNDLVGYFNKVGELHNSFFVFVDRLEEIKTLSYEKWFKQFIDTNNSLFIGRGLNNSTIHSSLVTPLRNLSILIPDNYGYNIKNGNAIRIKLVEGEEFDGE